jgi:hypothetical protein
VRRALPWSTAAAVLWAAAVFASGCSSSSKEEAPAAARAVVETIALGGGEELVLREGRRGGEVRGWRDEVELRRAGAAVWVAKVALFSRAFDDLAEADGESVVVAGQPPGSELFSLQVLRRADGKLAWSTAPRDRPPVWKLDGGDVFELTRTHVHRYDARSGERRWSREVGAAGDGVARALRVSEGEVTVIAGGGEELRLERATGSPI